jgi:Flp pilus assembly protein TadD
MGYGNLRASLKLLFFCYSLSLLAWPKVTLAQVSTVPGAAHGRISVRVKDADGSPIKIQAKITLQSPSLTTNVTTYATDADQAFFTGLNAGEYVVEVSAPGYRTTQVQVIIDDRIAIENIEIVMIPELSRAEMQGTPGPPVLAPKALKETKKGLQALQEGQLEKAETHLKRALQFAPGFPELNYLMGMLWIQKHDAAQARGYLEKAVQLAPKHAPALEALGEVQYLQKDYAHALQSLEQSLSLKPGSWRAHWLAGLACYQMEDYKKSREHAQEALEAGQEKAVRARLLLGEAQVALGEWEAALTTLEQFIREQSDSPQTGTAKELIAWLRSPKRQQAAAKPAIPR